WLDPNFLGDRPRAAPRRRQKNYPRPLQIALQSHWGATARLKHLAICPRKVDFSCFGYHPYLESRLTIQEKWVLVSANLGVMLTPEHAPALPDAVVRPIADFDFKHTVELFVVGGRQYSPALDAFIKICSRFDWQTLLTKAQARIAPKTGPLLRDGRQQARELFGRDSLVHLWPSEMT